MLPSLISVYFFWIQLERQDKESYERLILKDRFFDKYHFKIETIFVIIMEYSSS